MPKQQQSRKRIKLEQRYGKIGIAAVQSAAQYSGKKKDADKDSKDEVERLKGANATRKSPSRGQ